MTKKAIIVISLVPEASQISNSQIKKEIRKESQIPWCKQIKKVAVEDFEDCYEKLRGHGFSKKVARNIVKFYQG